MFCAAGGNRKSENSTNMKLNVPGSKSITNRALICAALARSSGKRASIIKNALFSDDTTRMIESLRALGVKILRRENSLKVSGIKLHKPAKKLFCKNAGTAVRFLTAVLATQNFESVIDGDTRMRQRPQEDLIEALRQLGANIEAKRNCVPLKIKAPGKSLSGGSQKSFGGKCTLAGNVSSQFLSGLLIAAPLAQKDVEINILGDLVSKPYVDLTISVLEKFGIRVARNGYKTFRIKAGQNFKPCVFEVEGDASSASYFWGISALTDSEINIKNVPQDSAQADILSKDLIEKMRGEKSEIYLKPLGKIDCKNLPDSAMTLAVLAACAKGKTELRGLSNLREKECDRLAALTCELKKIGCNVKELKDGLVITGDPEKLHGAQIETYNDHRMAMCFGMLSVVLPGIKITNPGCVKKTYPNFWKDLARVKKYLSSKNIVLTGMRGTGKSLIGSQLASKLGRKFIDTDKFIETSAKMTISKIVEKFGWKHFRKLEKRAAKKLSTVKDAVISTGGGMIIPRDNEKLFRKNGHIILLDCEPKTLQKRLKEEKNRPSLTGTNFLQELSGVYKKRRERYKNSADFILDVSKDNLAWKFKQILAKAKMWGMM